MLDTYGNMLLLPSCWLDLVFQRQNNWIKNREFDKKMGLVFLLLDGG